MPDDRDCEDRDCDARDAAEFSLPAENDEPMLAAVVAEAPSPLRFGLKAMLLVTAICGVQFALMNYLGILFGLIVGMVVCGGVLFCLIATAVVLHGAHGSRLMDRLDQLAIRSTVAMVLLVVGAFFAGGGVLVYEQVAKLYLTARIERQLGFDASWRSALYNETFTTVLVVRSVRAGGAFERAGFLKGDIIVTDQVPLDLVRWFDESHGRTVRLTVVAGPTYQPLEDCPQRQLTLVIPSRN